MRNRSRPQQEQPTSFEYDENHSTPTAKHVDEDDTTMVMSRSKSSMLTTIASTCSSSNNSSCSSSLVSRRRTKRCMMRDYNPTTKMACVTWLILTTILAMFQLQQPHLVSFVVVNAEGDFDWDIAPMTGWPIIAFDGANIDSEVEFKYSYTGILSESKILSFTLFQVDCLSEADYSALNYTTSILGNVLTVDVDVIQATITDSVHYTTSSEDATTAQINFCARVDYSYVDPGGNVMGINFHETRVNIDVDLTANFTVAGISVGKQAADVSDVNANVDYPVHAYFCNAENFEQDPGFFAQGDTMQVCVEIDRTIVPSNVKIYVADVLEFVLTQPEGPVIVPTVAINDGIPDPLTRKVCGTEDGRCNIKTQIPSKFFVEPNPNDLQIAGTALLAFGIPQGATTTNRYVRYLRANIVYKPQPSHNINTIVLSDANRDRFLQEEAAVAAEPASGEEVADAPVPEAEPSSGMGTGLDGTTGASPTSSDFGLNAGLVGTVMTLAPTTLAPEAGGGMFAPPTLYYIIAVVIIILLCCCCGIGITCCCLSNKKKKKQKEEQERMKMQRMKMMQQQQRSRTQQAMRMQQQQQQQQEQAAAAAAAAVESSITMTSPTEQSDNSGMDDFQGGVPYAQDFYQPPMDPRMMHNPQGYPPYYDGPPGTTSSRTMMRPPYPPRGYPDDPRGPPPPYLSREEEDEYYRRGPPMASGRYPEEDYPPRLRREYYSEEDEGMMYHDYPPGEGPSERFEDEYDLAKYEMEEDSRGRRSRSRPHAPPGGRRSNSQGRYSDYSSGGSDWENNISKSLHGSSRGRSQGKRPGFDRATSMRSMEDGIRRSDVSRGRGGERPGLGRKALSQSNMSASRYDGDRRSRKIKNVYDEDETTITADDDSFDPTRTRRNRKNKNYRPPDDEEEAEDEDASFAKPRRSKSREIAKRASRRQIESDSEESEEEEEMSQKRRTPNRSNVSKGKNSPRRSDDESSASDDHDDDEEEGESVAIDHRKGRKKALANDDEEEESVAISFHSGYSSSGKKIKDPSFASAKKGTSLRQMAVEESESEEEDEEESVVARKTSNKGKSKSLTRSKKNVSCRNISDEDSEEDDDDEDSVIAPRKKKSTDQSVTSSTQSSDRSAKKAKAALKASAKEPEYGRNRCLPLKPPLPTKFQGNFNKFRGAELPAFTKLINFPKSIAVITPLGDRSCVMCGELVSRKKLEPNRGMCSCCVDNVWEVAESGMQIKWCNGCNEFLPWAAFGEKGLTHKCKPCRLERIKQQKEGSVAPSNKPLKKKTPVSKSKR